MSLRLVVTGFGRAGEAHARYYRTVPDVEVVGVADRAPARRAAAAALFPAAAVAERLTDLAVRADLLIVATPPHSHAEDIRWGIDAGMHVVCEKPAVLDAGVGAELAAHAAAVPVVLYPNHNYVFAPFARRFEELLSAGRCGVPRHMEIDVERPGAADGVDAWKPSWRTDAVIAGGGVLVDHGAHCVYLAEIFMRAPVVSVSCTATRPERGGVDHDVDLHLLFEGGGTGRVRLSWTGTARRNRYLVRGGRGTLTAADGAVVVRDGSGEQRWAVADPAVGHHAHEDWLPELFADVRRRIARPRASARGPWHSAVMVARVVTAAYASAEAAGAWTAV
ncbi:Gfo/Idh/MocA family protein [Streptomyces sp. NPDC008313]|uniref:Gfo/Idh/MocA family protein n=1 Tax=Streptomyces sp. NPDC008313 TaxID=3364826 RepID=UPI0036E2D2F8